MADLSFGNIAQGYPGGMAPNPNATAQQQEEYRAGWMDTFQRPEVRAALLQFGLQAMQPVGIQQTGPGALAGAVGAGAEAYDTSVKNQQAQAQAATENQRAEEALNVQRSQVDAQLAGQQNQAEMSAADNTAAMDRLMLDIKGKKEIAVLPPNEQELIAGIAAKLISSPPPASYSDLNWADNAVEIARSAVERARPGGASTTPPVPAGTVPPAAPVPANKPPIPPSLQGKYDAGQLRWHGAMSLFQDKITGKYYNLNGEDTELPTQ